MLTHDLKYAANATNRKMSEFQKNLEQILNLRNRLSNDTPRQFPATNSNLKN